MVKSRNYIVFRNIDCRELGLYLTSALVITKAPKRGESITIPGRSGSLWIPETTEDKCYDSFTISAEFAIDNTQHIDEIAEYFDGSGWLMHSTEPYRKYKVRVAGQKDFIRWIGIRRKFTVTFEFQPFSYAVTDTVIDLPIDTEYSIINPGSIFTEPLLFLSGNNKGRVYINGIYQCSFIAANDTNFILDSENKLCYFGSKNLNSGMSGNYIKFYPGKNTIKVTEFTAAKLTICWRWL